ncbi:winged helix-turn-helix domain-containing protein [Streptomyces avicenniae]|uniref:winged helix-turn-helix domain-containing protein n=1 Tax=Streptomyces avicenniae TaxID=500153 RepID=UPI00069BFDDA|nr:helix-turn-helix domain-containing protein [Streptomyces avicenniae]
MPDEPERPAPSPAPTSRPSRRLDATSLRGLAHPLRMTLLDHLTLEGPATATGLAARVGESSGTVSWHLRHLARHGFITEDTGRGTRRERWWRVVEEAKVLDTAEFRGDPEASGALSLYLQETVRRQFARVTDYLGEAWDEDWQRAGAVVEWRDLRLDPAGLRALQEELLAVLARHSEAAKAAQAGPDALPVTVQIQAFPRRVEGDA